MSVNSEPAVGIDLGTTYSVVARLDDLGRPTTIANAEGELITPSAVLFDGGQIVVGKEALKAVGADAANVAQFAKRELGSRLFHKSLAGRRYSPEVIEAMILNKLRLDAGVQIGEFRKAVITVPAYFDEVRRKATQDAGYMAGLEVLDIVNEPTAAAIAHAAQKGLLAAAGAAQRPLRLVVYDLGGGTFDVTVMEVRGSEFVALATDGDARLGGCDWDQRLVDHVGAEFQRQHGVDPRQDPTAAGRLWRECEDAKRTLSARTKTSVPCEFQGRVARIEVARAAFEERAADLVERTRFTTQQALAASGLQWKDIDHLLLVGGASRMPMISRMLTELSGKTPDLSVAVDEAVAHGAAIRAGMILAQGAGREPVARVRNVNSHSLGVIGSDAETGLERVAVIVPRNTSLPISARRVFRTQREGQNSILVRIVEGESPEPEECTFIGKCTVRNLPASMPAQSPVEVRFVYRDNGRLSVRVSVPGAGREAGQEILRENSLTPEQLAAWREFITGESADAENAPADDEDE